MIEDAFNNNCWASALGIAYDTASQLGDDGIKSAILVELETCKKEVIHLESCYLTAS